MDAVATMEVVKAVWQLPEEVITEGKTLLSFDLAAASSKRAVALIARNKGSFYEPERGTERRQVLR